MTIMKPAELRTLISAIKQTLSTGVLFLLLTLISGCESDFAILPSPPAIEKSVTVRPVAQIQPIATTGDVSESRSIFRTYQCILLQFNENGQLLHISEPHATEPLSTGQLPLPPFELYPGENQTLVLLAALSTEYFKSLGTPADLNALYATKFAWQGKPEEDNFILASELKEMTVSTYGITSTNGPSIFSLKRTGCRLDFNYSFTVPNHTLTRIRIKGIPGQMNLFPSGNIYPAFTQNDTQSEIELPISAPNGSYQWFLPANARGIGFNTSTDPKLKTGEYAPDAYCTFIQIECRNNTDPQQIVRFNLYPGNDAINDYSLKANHAYGVTVNLKGIDETDQRIEGLGSMDAWVEIADFNQVHGNKKIRTIVYQLSDGSEQHYTITRQNQNRFYYALPKEELLPSKQIKGIRFLNETGSSWTLNIQGLHIPSEGDLRLDYSAENLKNGITYSWIFQGILNKNAEYEVCTARTLQNVERLLTGSFRQVAAIDLQSMDAWTPIGSNTQPFEGKYTGDGYRINHLILNKSTALNGLFGKTRNAQIDGIIIAPNSHIVANSEYLGAVVGMAINTVITRCANLANVSNEIKMHGSYTGGIAGYMSGGYFRDCYSLGDFLSEWEYKRYMGGIAGYVTDPTDVLKNCYNNGTMWGTQNENRGAIIGFMQDYADARIRNCFYNNSKSAYVVGNGGNTPHNTMIVGDHYGQPYEGIQLEGIKTGSFKNVLNENQTTGLWNWNSYRNQGNPYLAIEKE